MGRQGRSSTSGKLLAAIPVGEWVHVEIECALGKGAPGTYSLTLTAPGGDPERFDDIAITGGAFRAVHWLGFVSNAQVDSVFYADNLKVQPIER